ncbi:MAG: T9SS type A sorting domain-containing protein, partial [Candidatus Aegiribacteria sp.]|nr:T9SS type A sorting domain-containing protein [Candidatus Aegiribacteria sp.]MBD3295229.1 T9SS type A sorting domain-containing protein [Candidatus Fermentibacteria bacterium]
SDHGRVSVWNTIACLSGSFDTGTCLAEAWIRSPEGGGFCMMNTRYGWGEPSEPGDKWSELVDQEFFAKFFTEDLYHLGVAHAMAWDEYIPLIPSDTHYDWIAKSITLFGDPELPMWTQTPDGDLTVDGPDELNVGACNVTVNVSDGSGPLSDARVCFMQGEWDDPSMYEIGYTDASGQVQMDLTVSDLHDTAAMTVWSRNHALQTMEIPVVGTGINHQQGSAPVPFISSPSPNPAAGAVSFQYSTPLGAGTLSVYDASGRIVRTMDLGAGDSGTLVWNCSDDQGRPVPSGLYFARFATEGAEPSVRRIVVTAYE